MFELEDDGMNRDWVAPLIFGTGTFCLLMGALDAWGIIQVSQNPTALSMIGVGLVMLGAARQRNKQKRKR